MTRHNGTVATYKPNRTATEESPWNGQQKQLLVRVWGGDGNEGEGVKLVLFNRNLALNSDAAQKNTYVLGPRMKPERLNRALSAQLQFENEF